MDEDEAVRPNTPVARGREIDVRPDPGGIRSGDETTALRRPDPAEWPEGHTTGAFVSRAASLRHEVEPYRWWDALSPGWIFLWAVVLGAPVVAGAWAVVAIWARVHHG
jgi:hypothetical protein